MPTSGDGRDWSKDRMVKADVGPGPMQEKLYLLSKKGSSGNNSMVSRFLCENHFLFYTFAFGARRFGAWRYRNH